MKEKIMTEFEERLGYYTSALITACHELSGGFERKESDREELELIKFVEDTIDKLTSGSTNQVPHV